MSNCYGRMCLVQYVIIASPSSAFQTNKLSAVVNNNVGHGAGRTRPRRQRVFTIKCARMDGGKGKRGRGNTRPETAASETKKKQEKKITHAVNA